MSNECMYTYVAGMYVYIRCRNVCVCTCRNACIHMLQECMYIYVAAMHVCMLDYRNESCLGNVYIHTLQECM